MDLLIGCMIAGVSWLVAAWLSPLAGHDLYWPMAAGWALWAATDSRTHELKRYERVFPLDPLPLFIAVVMLFPVALPWYIRVKNRAMLGLLTVPARPSRARWVIAGVAVATGLGGTLMWFAFTRSATYATLQTVLAAVQSATPEQVNVTLHTSGDLTIAVFNTAVTPPERESTAYGIATAAVRGLPDSSSVTRVGVQFDEATVRAGVTVRRTHQSFSWPVAEIQARLSGTAPTSVGAPRAGALRDSL